MAFLLAAPQRNFHSDGMVVCLDLRELPGVRRSSGGADFADKGVFNQSLLLLLLSWRWRSGFESRTSMLALIIDPLLDLCRAGACISLTNSNLSDTS